METTTESALPIDSPFTAPLRQEPARRARVKHGMYSKFVVVLAQPTQSMEDRPKSWIVGRARRRRIAMRPCARSNVA
jgi:hypothetical protein